MFKNEYIMAPLKLGYCDQKDGMINNRHLEFYEKRSRYLGAIIAEPFYLESNLRENPFQLGLDADDKIEGLQSLAALLHEDQTGFIVHLNHPGRMANAMIPSNIFWSASDKACANGGAKPQVMDRHMMDHVLHLMRAAAQRAEKAGADMIELQFGYGYLIAQFLSPSINDRTDEYGGSFENRIRFPMEILKEVQAATTLPVMVRMSATDLEDNGFGLEEAIKLGHLLESSGVVALHITAGSACTSPAWYYQHMLIPKGKNWVYAAAIQSKVTIPVYFHGRIHSKSDIDFLRETHGAKYFSIGRALVADHDFVGKICGEVDTAIRPCLACSEACLGGVRAGKGLSCVVNPLVNTDLGLPVLEKQGERIAVAGAGLAGMQAAIVLKQRGYNVHLFESEATGGQFNLASLPPGKESLEEIVTYFVNELKTHEIPVIHQTLTSEIIDQQRFEKLVVATGSKPAAPAIEGLEHFYWAEILLQELMPKNKKVLVVGGGLIGTEIAMALLDHQNEVIIVELMDEIARGLEIIERNFILRKFSQKAVLVHTNTRLVRMNKQQAILQKNNETFEIEAIDHVVLATGMKPTPPMQSKIETYIVGDAAVVGKAHDAIRHAYEMALQV